MKSTKPIFDKLSRLYQKLPPRRIINSALRKTTDFIPRKVKLDKNVEFYGGPMKKMFTTGYEKGLKNLWKSEVVAPYLGIKDANKLEKMGLKDYSELMDRETVERVSIINTAEFEEKLNTLDQTERQALSRILSIITFGEGYALAVSASLINDIKGDGSRYSLLLQCLEEGKHLITLKLMLQKLDKIYPQTFWDFILFEQIIRANPTNRLFGMNSLLEAVALQFFSAFNNYPGLSDIMPFFHKDEARHTALPHNYAEEGGITFWDKHNPIYQVQRLLMVLPLIGLLLELEDDAKVLGIDIFEFGGKIINNVFRLSERSGYYLPINRLDIIRLYNLGVAFYKRLNYPEQFQGVIDLTQENTIKISEEMRKVEEDVFGTDDSVRGTINKLLEPGKRKLYELGVSILEGSR